MSLSSRREKNMKQIHFEFLMEISTECPVVLDQELQKKLVTDMATAIIDAIKSGISKGCMKTYENKYNK